MTRSPRQYENLARLATSGSIISNWERCPRKVWNFDGSNPVFPHYSRFQDFSFDVKDGSSADPFHFSLLGLPTLALVTPATASPQ